MKRIVLLRHGESTWNKDNRFTGWTDVDLTEKGIADANQAGTLLKEKGFHFIGISSPLSADSRSLFSGKNLPLYFKRTLRNLTALSCRGVSPIHCKGTVATSCDEHS